MKSLAIGSHLYFYSSVLGLANHWAFHKFEPTNSTFFTAFTLLLLEPLILCLISGYTNPKPSNTSLDFTTLVLSYLIFYATLGTSIAFYRISPFHPLAKIPGPIMFKLTKWWAVWKYKDARHHLILKDLHNVYGPIIRVGPNDISIADGDVINTVLGAKGLPKGTSYVRFRVPNHPGSLLVLKGDEYTARRRLWNRAMSPEALKGYESMIASRGQQLVERLEIEMKKDEGRRVNLGQWLNFFAFDLMSDMGFGGGSNMLKDGFDPGRLWSTIVDHASVDFLLGQVPWLPRYFDQKIPWLVHRQQVLPKIAMEWSMDRIKNGALKKDIWYHLMDEAGMEKEQPPIANVTADAILTIIAGSDTTSLSLTALFWLLLSHPECYRRVQREVDSVYPSGSDPLDVSKHSSLKYLSVCMNECLRLFPPVPAGGSREIPRGSGGKVIHGHFLPEGTQIYLPAFMIHRDPKNFSPRPDEFIPERWISSESGLSDSPYMDEKFTNNMKAYIPFSYGPGTCAGKNLARQEILMIISMLVQRFEFRFADGFDAKGWEDTLRSLFVTFRGPLEVAVSLRD